MRSTLALLLAAAAFGAVSPAAACDCFWRQLTDDIAAPIQPTLPAALQAQIVLRDGRGLSQAGFYNDPSVYLGASRRESYGTESRDIVRRRY